MIRRAARAISSFGEEKRLAGPFGCAQAKLGACPTRDGERPGNPPMNADGGEGVAAGMPLLRRHDGAGGKAPEAARATEATRASPRVHPI